MLVDGTEGKLSIEGEENLLEYIKTEVKDGKLVIKVKKGGAIYTFMGNFIIFICFCVAV